MNWTLKYLPEVEKDLNRLSGDQRILVQKAIRKVLLNPLPASEGGYGKPLGNKGGADLTGLLKIKLKSAACCVSVDQNRGRNAGSCCWRKSGRRSV